MSFKMVEANEIGNRITTSDVKSCQLNIPTLFNVHLNHASIFWLVCVQPSIFAIYRNFCLKMYAATSTNESPLCSGFHLLLLLLFYKIGSPMCSCVVIVMWKCYLFSLKWLSCLVLSRSEC